MSTLSENTHWDQSLGQIHTGSHIGHAAAEDDNVRVDIDDPGEGSSELIFVALQAKSARGRRKPPRRRFPLRKSDGR